MRYIISETQHKRIINEITEETLKKVSTNWFKKQISRGEDPHISGDLLMFLSIKQHSTIYDRLIGILKSFLGDGAYEAAVSRTSKVFDTSDYPEISGGYDFKFKVEIIDSDKYQLLLKVDVLPGGEVDLIMTDGGVRDLKDAMFDDEIGMEIYHESADVIYRIIEEEITDYTGFTYVVEGINYI
jgi:hypothetical protein